MIESDSHPPAYCPIDLTNRNLPCIHCGYNLRGLSGDPVRCPECGLENELGFGEIQPESIEKALQQMETAAAYGLAIILGVGGSAMLYVLTLRSGALGCFAYGAIGLAIAFPLVIYNCKKSCDGQQGWLSALLHYWLFGGLMIVGSLAAIAVLAFVARSVAGRSMVDMAFASLLFGAVILFWALVPWVRWMYALARRPLCDLQRELAIERARHALRQRVIRIALQGGAE